MRARVRSCPELIAEVEALIAKAFSFHHALSRPRCCCIVLPAEIYAVTPIAHRTAQELAPIMVFLNTLPLRTDLRGSPTFPRATAHLNTVRFGAYAHHQLPLRSWSKSCDRIAVCRAARHRHGVRARQ